jgi:transposase
VARPAQGPAAEEHGARLSHPLVLGRDAPASASCALRPGPRAGGQGGQPDGRDHRQPEREERRKGGTRVDPQGYDAGKKVKGKKRHILVDTLGLLWSAAIHPANIQDRDGAVPLLRAARRLFPFVEVIFADGAYQGETTAEAVAGIGSWRLEIVRRNGASGFVPLPPSAGSWRGRSRGSGAAAGWPRTSRTLPSTRSPSSAWA